ncbi:MAG: AarF/ABC1/UbiB kinase family protein [Tetrasphaera jenkinsii]|uniref:Putative ABC transporter ATP-binding protein n=1 Tax=Nostocoides jenkinsii Ben 74 TaxID=1193518 RepID=A0A077MEY3_9MICO|nr:AarF/ABC1/UbiB kinase family protein [Tetrasphaera jenkinsii]MCI1262084.1 AarF/ABC1/UbiB kinase family protein [Tetrasphaera jenkinsii]CCI54550.1 putative ABC transporter ATP-binding protein [Tetrasphaera jenkinsii Ben 74]
MSELPRRTARRTAKLVGLPLGVAGRTALGIGKRVGGRPAEAVAAEIQARTAEQLFTVLGELKGGAMKVGQALSVMEAAMPEEWAAPYRATLTKLQEAAPPLPPAAVHAVLAAELGPRWRTAKFLEFDDIPAAAASIGQVHKATWRDGRTVAVKIQYPGAREALLSDLRQLSRLARVSAGWVPGLDIKPVMAELTSRMSEELDYLLEATHQRAFAKVFRGDPDFAIPEVVHASSAVLVSEWLPGVPLSRIIAEGDQPTRDAAAQLYLEFLLAGPQRAGQLHADPHPGNFRITPDGRLGILDFGAVNRLPGGLPPVMGRLLTHALASEAEPLVAGLRAEGFIKPTIEVDPESVLSYLRMFLEPLEHDRYRFDRAWLRSVALRINDVRRPEWTVGIKLNLPPEYLLIHRVWLGGIGVLCQIGGEVSPREALAHHLAEFDLDRLPPPLP